MSRPLPADYMVSGGKECLELAEALVEEIKKGRTRYLGYVRCESPSHADASYGGSIGCEFAANWGYDLLKNALQPKFSGSAAASTLLDLSYACYDLRRAPISFDIIPWLIDREMTRIRSGLPGPLKVAFTAPPADRLVTPANQLMLEAVLFPMVEMIGVIDPVAATTYCRTEFYCNRPIVESAKRGEKVPFLKPRTNAVAQAEAFIAGRPPVTITLRETSYDVLRNSRKYDWLLFAEHLRSAGERVVIIRDTAVASEPIEDFEICPQASRDLHFRLALYERAKNNFFVSNGPVALAMFSEAPFIFINEVLDHPDSGNKAESWSVYHGTNPGEQLPWSRPDQRIVWGVENYETIRAAWDDFVAMKQAA
jgi:hypothetical protein